MVFRPFLPALALLLAPLPALATAPDHALVTRVDDGAVTVSWHATAPVDVLVADQPDAPVASATLAAAHVSGGSVQIAMAAIARRFVLLRDSRSGDVTRVAERVVPLVAGSNFRDIGGYDAANGRHVRWGMIYRSGATPLLTLQDQAEIATLGLTEMVDLRSDEERVLAPTRIEGVPYRAVGYSMRSVMAPGGMEGTYRTLPTLLQPHLRAVFAHLLRREGPIAYNCSAGQDRTGFVTAVILSALGTPWDEIVADYHLSTALRKPDNEMPKIDAARWPDNFAAQLFAKMQAVPGANAARPLLTSDGRPLLVVAFAELNDRWGGVDGYLHRALGLSDADLASLRTTYTE